MRLPITGATIAGGGSSDSSRVNSITASFGSIGGGRTNLVSGLLGTIAGGQTNTAGLLAAVGGGESNLATGFLATIPGGQANAATAANSFAAGIGAKANHQGAFVWADSTAGSFASAAVNQFLIRAAGGVGIGTSTPASALEVNGDLTLSKGFARTITLAPQPLDGRANGDSLTLKAGNSSTQAVAASGGTLILEAGAGFNANQTARGGDLILRSGPNAITGVPNGGDLIFQIGGPNFTFVERLCISENGSLRTKGPLNVNLSAFSADNTIRAASGTVFPLVLELANGNSLAQFQDPATSGISFAVLSGSAVKQGGGSWAALSDRRLKEEIEPLEGSLDQLLRLRSVSFVYKDPTTIHELPGRQIGFIAQEVEEVFPAWVGQNAEGYKYIAVKGFEFLAVEALRELRTEKNTELAQVRAENAALTTRLASLEEQALAREARLQRLEAALAEKPPSTPASTPANPSPQPPNPLSTAPAP